MNNQDYQYKPLKFKSEDDARQYFLTNDVDSHISKLHGEVQSLLDRAVNEVPQCMGHGYPDETISGHLASYIGAEATRLCQIQKYLSGGLPTPGYRWKWNDHGNQDVYEELNLDGATKDHPVFLQYAESNGLNESRHQEAFNFWLKCHKNPSMNNVFKLAYTYKLENLIPDNVKLSDMIKFKKPKARKKKY